MSDLREALRDREERQGRHHQPKEEEEESEEEKVRLRACVFYPHF